MEILALIVMGAMIGYQTEKPCDDACFQKKIAPREHKIEDRKNDNSWRYRRPDRRD
jgi:hypothetical protein